MAITWFIFVFCWLHSHALVFGCPVDCECRSNNFVTCTFTQTTDLLTGIPPTTTQLNLDCDSWTSIKPTSGLFSSLPNLKTNLKILSVTNCFNEPLAVGIFRDLVALEILTIFKCPIKWLEPGVFSDTPSLKILELRQNGIAEIKPRTFVGLTKLTELQLDQNRIERIDIRAFKGVDPMNTKVSLSGNRLICDCHLERVWKKFVNSSPNNPNIPCAGDNELADTRWKSLDSEKLNKICPVIPTYPPDRTEDNDKSWLWIWLALAGFFVVLANVLAYCVIKRCRKTKTAKKKKEKTKMAKKKKEKTKTAKKKKEKSRSKTTSDSKNSETDSDSEKKPLLE